MKPFDAIDSAAWFAVRTKSNREAVVTTALTGRGYDAWYPRYRDHRSKSSPPNAIHASCSGRAAFPGYVFCRLDASKRLPVLTVPGIVGIVSSGKTPLPIDEKEILSLRLVMESELPVSPYNYLKIDDRVKVTNGPLSGAEGYVIQSDSDRLVVSITLLQRSVAVEVSGQWLEKLPVLSR